jgi:sugar phosphate permease
MDAGKLANWRGQVFTAAWFLYAGYYICRKDLAPGSGASTSHLAVSLACFGATYAIGQVAGGILADRVGARRTALAGAAISIVCTCLLAWSSRQPALALMLQLGNGFGQGFGWPAMLKLIGNWFRRGERDRVLGWWSTSYILGGLLATSLTSWLVVQTGVAARTDFYPAHIISSGMLLCAALFFYKETGDLPEDTPDATAHTDLSAQRTQAGAWSEILANRDIRTISITYFFLKMTRYTLLFWLPLYLTSSMGESQHSADHIASYLELLGFLGPLAAGYAVQRWFGERRIALGASMLFALAFVCLLHPLLAASGWFGMACSISMIGILIYGADVLLSAMAVLEAVPDELHGRAAGFVNGIGSVGQMLSPFLVTVFVSRLGWTKLFDLFVCFSLVAGVICAFGARRQTSDSSRPNRSILGTPELPV